MDEHLLKRVAAGETDAVAACVDRFGGLIWSLARRILGRPSETEDAVQEIFIEIWKSASRYDSSIATETAFVAMIARRRLIDIRRRLNRQPSAENVPVEELPLQEADGPDHVEVRDEAARATAAMQQLRPEQRRVLNLAVCQGWPHQLIADQLGIPLGTVKTHVRPGLIRIREEIESHRTASGQGGAT